MVEILRVTLTLSEPLLGTVPYNPDVYKRFIQTKAPPTIGEDESLTVEERELTGWSGFHKEDDEVFFYDYQLKGMLKELSRISYPKGNEDALKAIASKIEQFVYVRPRRIYPQITGPIQIIERPLRAQTMQGPRVTVVRSDAIPAGSTIEFEIHILPGPISTQNVMTALELGEYRGLGQWRNGGFGRFTARVTGGARRDEAQVTMVAAPPVKRRRGRPRKTA